MEKEKKRLLSFHVRGITARQTVPKNQMLPELLSRKEVHFAHTITCPFLLLYQVTLVKMSNRIQDTYISNSH